MRPIRLFAATALLAAISIFGTIALGAATGSLKLDVLGADGAGAKNPAHLIAANGKEAGQVTAGSTIALPPGNYKLVLPIIGGPIGQGGGETEGGRTQTAPVHGGAA